jgi:simple sugar transport system permease protein
MNGILVLSLIPMLNAGIGMNFGLPIGITSGLIGMCIAINFRLTGMTGFLGAILFTVPTGVAFGWVYGLILNKVKGREEIAGTFLGFSFIPLMNYFWTLAPFQNRQMLYPIGGAGLRPKIGLNPYFTKILDTLFVIKIKGVSIPLGMLIFYSLICVFIYTFFKSKLGRAMIAVGENEHFSYLSGINILNARSFAIILSTTIAGVGICVYAQSYGFLELYNSPLMMAFPAVSAILIGGSTGRKTFIFEAILGTYVFQSIYLLSVPLANELLVPEIAEIFRMMITNAIILYALLKKERGVS